MSCMRGKTTIKLGGDMKKEDLDELVDLAKAYEEADECDYCQSGKFQGLAPYEIARRIVAKIFALKLVEGK